MSNELEKGVGQVDKNLARKHLEKAREHYKEYKGFMQHAYFIINGNISFCDEEFEWLDELDRREKDENNK